MISEKEEQEKMIDVLIASNKDEEVWYRVAENLKRLVDEMEKQLKELPSQLKANKELLEFAKTKAPVKK